LFEIKLRNMQVNNVTNSDMEKNLENPTENIVCAIDIGTSKIAALVGRRNQFGKLKLWASEIVRLSACSVVWWSTLQEQWSRLRKQ
jgi:hypothetical protein